MAKFSKLIAPVLLVATLASGLYFTAPRKAEAASLVVPVFDKINTSVAKSNSVSNWKDFGQNLLEWAMDLATSFLRRTLLNWIQDAIISAVQGNGVPKLVVNWGDLFEEATAGVQDAFIRQLGLQEFCSPFSIELEKILIDISLPIYTPETFKRGNYCTLQNIIGNTKQAFEDFKDDFRQGGFIAFQEAISPQNDFLPSILRNQNELLSREAFASYTTFTEVGIAGQGFKDTKVCDKNGENCRSKTVGKTTGDLLSKSAGSDIDFILSAERLTEVLTSIATLLVSTIIQEGLTEVAGIFDPADRERAIAEVNQINNDSFDSYKNQAIASINEAVSGRTEVNQFVSNNIAQLQAYVTRLTGYLNEVNTKLAANPGANQCNRSISNNNTDIDDFGRGFFDSQVNITELKSNLQSEIDWANGQISSLQSQFDQNTAAVSDLNIRKSEIQGLSNNTSGQLALSRVRDEILPLVEPGSIAVEGFTAETSFEDNELHINDQLNKDASGSSTDGFNIVMPKLRVCNNFY